MTQGNATPDPHADPSDADLIAQVREGDPGGNAFRLLFDRHWPALRQAASRLTGQNDADDVAQQVMVRVFEAIEAGGGPTTHFRPYALAAIRNEVVSMSRRRVPTPVADVADDDQERPGGAEPVRSHEQAVVDRALLVQAFRQLPDNYQQLLWETIVEGHPPRDLARHYGSSANAVAVNAARAREALRRAWLRVHLPQAGERPECERALKILVRTRRGETLPASAQAALDEHLLDCADCRAAALSIEELAVRLPAALVPGAMALPLVAGASGWGALKSKLAIAAAAAVVAAGGGAVVVELARSGSSSPQAATVATADVPSPTDTTVVSAAASTRGATPSPSPTSSALKAPTIVGADRPVAWLVPTVRGTATPRMVVVLRDQTGQETARGRADSHGTWSLTPGPVPDGAVLHAYESSDGRLSAPSAVSVTVRGARPALVTERATVRSDDGGLVVPVDGVPGRYVRASLDGVPALPMRIPADGVLRAVWLGVTPGTHTFTVWYVDKPTGRGGTETSATVDTRTLAAG